MVKRLLAILCLAVLASGASAEEPKTMGKCGPEKKKDDECALGTCFSGKQTVYKCAEDKTCTRSDTEKDCEVKK